MNGLIILQATVYNRITSDTI